MAAHSTLKVNVVRREDLHYKVNRVAEAAGYARNAVLPALLAVLNEEELVAYVKDAV